MKFVTETDRPAEPPFPSVEFTPVDPAQVERIRRENLARLRRLNAQRPVPTYDNPISDEDFTWTL